MNKIIRIRKKGLIVLLVLTAIIFYALGSIFVYFVFASNNHSKEEKAIISVDLSEIIRHMEKEKEEPEETKKYLGKYTVTAYCSCKKCCGKYAENRPNGKVYGAYGVELKANHSVASSLPKGTEIEIDGIDGIRVIEDKTANWIAEKYNNKIIDLYFDSHEEALKWGKQELDVWEVVNGY